MNKNWNDRADKDLFFTILSVKNIGVISGAEWTTIGNHMRALGYGFTNEGCRQHFQGLRRAQNKADANGTFMPDGTRRPVDPTLNPITRRPGPGRGRPRKQPQTQPPPGALPQPLPQQIQQQPQVQVPVQEQHQPQQQQQPPQMMPTQIHTPVVGSMQPSESPTLSPPVNVTNAMPAPMSVPVPVPVSLEATDSLTIPDHDEDEEPDGHVVKRQRLDDSPPEQTLNDNDVLGQLTHGNPPDSYPSPTFNYAET
ncbi:hypothetical protein jhhlp_004327 [Lomentospora prolificans]|uniref:Myb-like domain-containing protein n=1 Tax=Lomentospora prolificans TaxID=41688 RepID=A0A2N3NB83_9PEZI|nr:hypothetical protein jhhlp_004327 [Lomentospora prolificans]